VSGDRLLRFHGGNSGVGDRLLEALSPSKRGGAPALSASRSDGKVVSLQLQPDLVQAVYSGGAIKVRTCDS
jgi:hypothetical protein